MINLNDLVKGPFMVTGSSVLEHRFIKDIDVICYREDIPESILAECSGDEYLLRYDNPKKPVEFLLANKQESLQTILIAVFAKQLTEIEALYCLKYGHIHVGGRRQENWEKHIYDLRLLSLLVDTEKPIIKTLASLHKKCTDERVNQKTPKLNGVQKGEFFDDKAIKYIDHDEIHEEVAYGENPAFQLMQLGDGTVECHKHLWDAMSHENRLQCVVEETSVIAIERFMLPFYLDNKEGKPLFLAYKWALYRVCTNLTSGFFRRFAINNYFEALNMYDEEKLNENIKNIIKKIKNEQ